jgi:predicted phage terminase large subunit-like protein
MSSSNDDARRLLELEQEQWYRQCRMEFIPFCIEALSAHNLSPALHHRLIASELQAMMAGKFDRLMILAPPGSAKTTYTSRLFPAWAMACRPRLPIITASHTASLALENAGHIQRIIRDHKSVLGYTLSNDAKDLFHTSNHSQVLATSIGGTVRGFRAGLIILDDPIKSREEAGSLTIRDGTWTWFTSDLASRLLPGGKIVIVGTPMHEDDLLGRLLRIQPEQWKVLRLRAFATADDPLGRQEGEPLWADDPRTPGYPDELRAKRAEYEQAGLLHEWFGQYQTEPRVPAGNMFKPHEMPILEQLPNQPLEQIRAWDLAATPGGGDYTVGIKLARCRLPDYSDLFVITDARRLRGAPEEVQQLVNTTAIHDGHIVKIAIPIDPGQAGKDQVTNYTKLLLGFAVISERVSGSKTTRAFAAAAAANIGKIAMLKAPWNYPLIEELAAFPTGLHDDQVDALASAFNLMTPSRLSQWLRL